MLICYNRAPYYLTQNYLQSPAIRYLNLLRSLSHTNGYLLYFPPKNILANGVLIEKSTNAENVKFALLFEFDGDVKAIRHVLYKCTASRPSIESETKEDTIEPGTEKLTITADPRSDGLVKARTGDDIDSTTYQNWYQNVYESAGATGVTGATGNTGGGA